MAKKRYVSDSFWSDNWVDELQPLEKYLFLYFLTNSCVSICGIYEIPIKRITYETGIEKEMVLKILQKFENDKKVYYYEGIICIVNFIKNQNINSKEDNLLKGIDRETKELGNKLALILSYKDLARTLQGAYKDIDILNLTLLYSTLLNFTLVVEDNIVANGKFAISNFNNILKIGFTEDFIKSVYDKYGISKQDFQEECLEFAKYWTEKSINGKKERWQKEKSFDVNLRFERRMRNNKKWSKKEVVIVNKEEEERKLKLAELEKRKKELFNN